MSPLQSNRPSMAARLRAAAASADDQESPKTLSDRLRRPPRTLSARLAHHAVRGRVLRIVSPVALIAVFLVFAPLVTAFPAGPADSAAPVEICHVPPGSPENARTITIAEYAVAAHLAQESYLGPCDESGGGSGPGDNETDDDAGHGNDDDGCDEDNPGQSGPDDCGGSGGNETDDDSGDSGPSCDGGWTGPAASIRIEWANGSEVMAHDLFTGENYTFYARGYDANGTLLGDVWANWTQNGTLDPIGASEGCSTWFAPTTPGTNGTIIATYNPVDTTGLLVIVASSTGGGSSSSGGGGGGGGSNGFVPVVPGPGPGLPADPPAPPAVPPAQAGDGLASDLAPPVIPGIAGLGLTVPMSLGIGAALMALYGLNRGALPLLRVQHALPQQLTRARVEAIEPETGEVLGIASMVEEERIDGLVLWTAEIAGRRKGAFRLQVAADGPDAFRVDDLGMMGLHKDQILFYRVGHDEKGPSREPPTGPGGPPVAPAPATEAPTTERAILSVLAGGRAL